VKKKVGFMVEGDDVEIVGSTVTSEGGWLGTLEICALELADGNEDSCSGPGVGKMEGVGVGGEVFGSPLGATVGLSVADTLEGYSVG
jgi:hypothetical protein